ncbi:tetraacyldisaccharide 4'-kinase [Parafilimonas sp.]|uniref:tetraacyldisaccharide 4'-kinase n=1 Tax=Parafilimonas sp. TaxID=1969739 RepID=UPI003F7DB52D
MNLNAIFLRSFRILLLPFSLLYGLAIVVRNFFYNKKIFQSASFNLPVICIGNLSLGGTGKSPMVEYLLELLHDKYATATLSRGYKRKTKGYALANENTNAIDIGDEPMQFYTKFPDVAVAVGEERIVAIPQLLHDKPGIQVIILDDAFQHRAIKAGLNILLTVYDDLYTDDFFFPTGDLRDQKVSAKRADIIVVTKCPLNLSAAEKEKIIQQLNPLENQRVFFTAIQYQTPYHIISKNKKPVSLNDEVLLVHGIANPQPLKNYISEISAAYDEVSYSDHHIFSIDDLKDINKKFTKIQSNNKLIITTEKDAVRLLKFKEQLLNIPLYVLPVKPVFLFDSAEVFNNTVTDFVNSFKKDDIETAI